MNQDIRFLALIIGKDEIGVDPKKSISSRLGKKPETMNDLRIFLGLIQFFRKFTMEFS